jgi:hypothetical protein
MPVPGGVIFCDDVRREDSGKEIVIGIYANNIIIPNLPTKIVNLWSIATITFARDESVSQVTLRLILPDGMELKQPSLPIKPFGPLQDGADFRMLKFRSHFQEVELTKTGRIRLVADIDGVDLRIGGLDVLEAEAFVPSNPGALVASYIRKAAKITSDRAANKEELAKDFQEWAREISSIRY